MTSRIETSNSYSSHSSRTDTRQDNPIDQVSQRVFNDGTTDSLFTTANLQRFTWCVLSAATASAPLIAKIFFGTVFSFAGTAAAVPVASLVLAGLFAYNAYSIRDYESTTEVAKYRKECESLSIEQAFRKHGNFVEPKILLTQEQVTEKCLETENTIPGITELKEYRKSLETLLKNTSFTLPSLKESHEKRLKQSCSLLTLDQAWARHGLGNLLSWELFSPEDFKEKYLEKESSLRSLPDMENLHRTVEAALRECDLQNTYTLPKPGRLLPKIQADCLNMSFEEIEKLHTLPFIFSRNLLSPEEFATKYRKHAEYLFAKDGIGSVIALFKRTQDIYTQTPSGDIPYSIPHPRLFHTLWMAQDLSLEQVLKHNVAELIEFEVIQDPVYIQTLRKLQTEFSNLKSDYIEQKSAVEHTYQDAVLGEQRRLDREKNTTRLAKALIEQKQLEKDRHIHDLRRALSAARSRGDFAEVSRIDGKLSLLFSESLLSEVFVDGPDRLSLNRNLSSAEQDYRQNIERLLGEKTGKLLMVENNYMTKRLALEKAHLEAKPLGKK